MYKLIWKTKITNISLFTQIEGIDLQSNLSFTHPTLMRRWPPTRSLARDVNLACQERNKTWIDFVISIRLRGLNERRCNRWPPDNRSHGSPRGERCANISGHNAVFPPPLNMESNCNEALYLCSIYHHRFLFFFQKMEKLKLQASGYKWSIKSAHVYCMKSQHPCTFWFFT